MIRKLEVLRERFMKEIKTYGPDSTAVVFSLNGEYVNHYILKEQKEVVIDRSLLVENCEYNEGKLSELLYTLEKFIELISSQDFSLDDE